ncbi:hypothetical protein PR202_gb22078 [Eleusine coracana subsp. coracana]|uniref:Uncharacterized protein n=1 Tax=Eleusine coracana subsp. coracana TaxID=191504 RepID=A0AAV5FFM8_ELECO|nr:hypothetical protein PR202_gb22078 [Eleusine coracana subsp. coracana]
MNCTLKMCVQPWSQAASGDSRDESSDCQKGEEEEKEPIKWNEAKEGERNDEWQEEQRVDANQRRSTTAEEGKKLADFQSDRGENREEGSMDLSSSLCNCSQDAVF